MNDNTNSDLPVHTHALSPASPKPILLPSPSNIAILNNPQMEADLNASDQDSGFEEATADTTEISSERTAYTDNTNVLPGVFHPSITDPIQPVIDSLNVNASTSATDATPVSNSDDPSHLAQSQAGPAAFTAPASQSDVVPPSEQENSTDHALTKNDMFGQANASEPHATHNDAGGVNFDALLDNLSSNTSHPPATQDQSASVADSSQYAADASSASQSIALSSALGATLPPRPYQQPSSHNETGPTQAGAPPTYDAPSLDFAHQTATAYPPPNYLHVPGIGALGGALAPNGMPPPPLATFQQPSPSEPSNSQTPQSMPNYRQRDPIEFRDSERKQSHADDDATWDSALQTAYDAFLTAERRHTEAAVWDQFPIDSRMFVGNLPTEKIEKRDLFQVFHKYGELAQISLKQAYGFVQFMDSNACRAALNAEQNVLLGGRKLHLEISKPQKSTRGGGGNNGGRGRNRRSRSPESGRRDSQRSNDTYRGGANSRQKASGRDDWRPASPPGRRGNGDRYNGRARSRSRSPPYGRHGRRSPSPRNDDDGLPLPRRDPSQVPDVQVIARDDPDRNFLVYIENSFERRDIRCNVLMLSPRLDEPAVLRRQILEGVLAVMKLDRATQSSQKFRLTIFDRSRGASNVNFEEYENLDLPVCIELVSRAKTTHRAPAPPPAFPNAAANAYGLPVIPNASAAPPANRMANPGNLQNAIGNLDPAALQSLLGVLQRGSPMPPIPSQQIQQQQQQHQPINSTADLSRLLAAATGGGVGGQGQVLKQGQGYGQPQLAQQQQQQAPQQQQQQQFANLASNPAFAALFANGARPGSAPAQTQTQLPAKQQPPQQAGQAGAGLNMANIMEQLSRYGR